MNKTLLWLLIVFMISWYSCERSKTKKAEPLQNRAYREINVNEYGDSIYMFYTSRGRLQSKATYNYGMKNGIAFNYYEDGTVQDELWYVDDFKNGPAKWYYKSGKLYSEATYKQGYKDGLQKFFYENGALKAEVPYKNDELLVGTKEYMISGKPVTDYPTITVTTINKLKEESTFYLRIALKPEKTKVNFYLVDGEQKASLVDYTKDGVVMFPLSLSKGQSVTRKIEIRAIIKTRQGNPMLLQRSYDVSIENK